MDGSYSLRKFFASMMIVAILSACNTNLSGLSDFQIMRLASLTFAFNLTMGIPGGLSWMFGTDLYPYIKDYIKKNLFK